jgi:hypothetical protein
MIKLYMTSRALQDMANWPDLMFRARMFVATEPGFLANQHIEMVNLNGGHLGYCLAIGLNLATPEGRNAADYHAALLMFCYQLRDLGVGHLPFDPAPHHPVPPVGGPGGAPGGPVGPVPGGPVGPVPEIDQDFVQILGGVHPIFGAWVEPEEEEVIVIGGVHPLHGPWVEGEQLPPGGDNIDDIVNEVWEELFGHENDVGQEAVNEAVEDNIPNN